MLIVDLKGDPALYNTVRLEAERAIDEGRAGAFRLLTADPYTRSATFDPLSDMAALRREPQKLAEVLCQCLNLDHGTRYGAGYYSTVHLDSLTLALEDDSEPRTFADIAAVLDRVATHRDGLHVRAEVRSLCRHPFARIFPQAADAEPSENHVDMHRVIREREIVYVMLPSLESGQKTMSLARLAVWGFALASQDLAREQGRARQSYAVIDEFQQVASHNLAALYDRVRSTGVSLLLANQSLHQLEYDAKSAVAAIKTNAELRVALSISTEVEQRELMALSGEKRVWLRKESSSSSETTTRSIADSLASQRKWGEQEGETSKSGTAITKSSSYSEGIRGGTRTRGTSKRTDTSRGVSSGASHGGASSTGETVTEGISNSTQSLEGWTEAMQSVLSAEDIVDVTGRMLGGIVLTRNQQSLLREAPNGSQVEWGGRPRAAQALFLTEEDTWEERKAAGWPPGPPPEEWVVERTPRDELEERIRRAGMDDEEEDGLWDDM